MTLFVIVAAGMLAYLHWTGQITAGTARLIAAGALLAVALRLLVGGQTIAALAVGGGAVALGLSRKRAARAEPPLDVAEAREILGVGPEATREDIRAAHRRLIAQVHPDHGGSAYLSRRVNAARDLLLRNIGRERRRAAG